VVSQTVGGDELLLAVAEPAQIAALSHIARDPVYSVMATEAKKYPQIVLGDAETILKFSPTLVLFADYSRAELVEQVRRAGVRAMVFDHYKTLDDAFANLRLLGRELGPAATARAYKTIADCQARMRALEEKLRGRPPVRVIAPSTYGVIGGADTTFQDLCDHAGATNLADTLGHLHGHEAPPNEQMLSWPVDKLVVSGTNLETALAPYRTLPPYQFMPAVREGRAVMIDECLMSSVTQHRVEGYEQLAVAALPLPAARAALPIALLLLGILMLASLGIGDVPLSPARIWAGLRQQDDLAQTIVWNLRLPRLLVAMAVGAALSASGLVMQAYFRNSLASPDLLGVSSGGAAGAVVAIGIGWTSASLLVLPLCAIVGSLLATGGVILLARRGTGTERLLLAGVALNALLGAVTSYVLSNYTISYERNAQIIFWLLGGLDDRSWEHVWIVAPVLLAAAALWPLGRQMDLLSLGAAEAQSLGVNVRALRRTLLGLATVMTALATAAAGTVGFVGLVVPHVLRLIVGPEHRRLVPLTLVGGAAFVVACDLLGRLAGGLRVGIVTALVGGPFFLWLLRRQP
jgi:iron complex transport system permease protein